ncbi:Pre-mRNA-splicing factor cwc15 [Paramyrothecium foliicola]|nr:Pre-mRNA-splicing factor cwc15 [Paramyrothecium foliicola]
MIPRISVSVGRLTSNEGATMGPSSDVIVKTPSKGRSVYGTVTSAETFASTLDQTSVTARGKELNRGPGYGTHLLAAHTKLKYRKAGQGGDADEEPTRDLAAELLAAEAAHYKKDKGVLAPADEDDEDDETEAAASTKRPLPSGDGETEEDLEAKRRRILAETRQIDADDSSEEEEDSDDDDDDSDDEDAELQRELERVRREREEKKRREEAEQMKIEEEARERNIALGNPLLNKQDFNMKRRWDDDVVFKNQARGTEDRNKKKEFVNQPLLHLVERAEHVAVLLVDAVAEPVVDLLDRALLGPPLADEVGKRLALVALDGPDGLVRAAEGAGAAADVELVDAVDAAQDVADDARDGRVQRAAADEVDAPRLGGQVVARAADEVLGAQAHGEGLRLDDDAGVLLLGPAVRLLQVATVGIAGEPPGAGADVGHRLTQVEVEAELGLVAVGGDIQRLRVEDGLVEVLPARLAALGLGQLIADLLARQAAVLVAEHEHVVAGVAGVVEKVVRLVRLVLGGVHEEGGRGAERDDGVEGPQGKREDGGRIVAREGDDLALRAKAVAGDEVGGDGAHGAAAVHADLSQLLPQLGHAVLAARGEREQVLVVLLLGDVPQVHAACVGDVERRDGAHEHGGQPRGDEGDARRLGVHLGLYALDAHDLRACEALHCRSMMAYMVRTAARRLRQLLPITQRGVEGVAFALRALILPVGRPLAGQRLVELVDKRLTGIQAREQAFGLGAPPDAAVLLAGAAHALDAVHGDGHGLGEAVEDEVERLEPQGDGGVDLARLLADVDALVDAILLAEVAVEVDLDLGDRLEVGADDNG